VMFIVLIGLGTWQLERKTWKEGLIAALAARTSAAPVALPAPERWSALDPMSDEFRRVTFAAPIAAGREVLVYGSGSSVRPDVSGPGYGCLRRPSLRVAPWSWSIAASSRRANRIRRRICRLQGASSSSARCAGLSRGAGSCLTMIRRAISGSHATSWRWRGRRLGQRRAVLCRA